MFASLIRRHVHRYLWALILIGAIWATTLSVWNALAFLGVHNAVGMSWYYWPPRMFIAFLLVGLVAVAIAGLFNWRAQPADWLNRVGIIAAVGVTFVQVFVFFRLR